MSGLVPLLQQRMRRDWKQLLMWIVGTALLAYVSYTGVAQSYGVFNDDAGFANRGTFVLDRSGIIRFAEMKQPGQPRDQAVWTDALKALKSD